MAAAQGCCSVSAFQDCHSAVRSASLRAGTHRRPQVAYGERRSANRTRWAESDTWQSAEDDVRDDGPMASAVVIPQVLEATEELYDTFLNVDYAAAVNLQRVQAAMAEENVGPYHFAGSTGYGHGDLGRAAYDQVLAKVMGTEACMARIGIASADHALACALFGQLRPGDHALFVSQALEEGTQALLSGPLGSLEDWGVKCTVVDPFTAGLIDENGALDAIRIAAWARKHKPNVVVLQRLLSPVLVHNGGVGTEAQDSSLTLCGGHFVTCSAIQSFGDAVRGACVSSVDEHSAHVMHGVREGDSTATAAHASEQSMRIPLVVVDNRGGEFVEELEPGDAGADLVTGSLLGSLGGSIAPSGGYVCGTQELIEKACARFCAPGMSLNSGAVPGDTLRLMFQGLFMAPTLVGEAMKGGMLLRKVLSNAQHDVLSPCIVHTQCSDATRDSGAEHQAVHLPGTSACMGSTDAMHAMLRAVEDCACMPAAPGAPLPQMLVSSAPSSDGGENPRRSVQRDADKKKLAGGYKVLHAGGSFVQGSAAEIGASGVSGGSHHLMRFQGGVHWSQWVNVLSAFLSGRSTRHQRV